MLLAPARQLKNEPHTRITTRVIDRLRLGAVHDCKIRCTNEESLPQAPTTERLERRDKPAWMKEMKELYIEDLASHDGLESCAVVREGAGEALTGVRAGPVIEPRNQGLRGADVVKRGGRQHRRSRYREWPVDPARSKNRCMHGVSRRENREIPRSPVLVDDAPSGMVRGVAGRRVAGREGNAKAVRPR